MNEADIEQCAQEVLEAFPQKNFPVDPFSIAEAERILVGALDAGTSFDGRIEYRRKPSGPGRFYLFYAVEDPPSRPEGRVRFSVAHELGHYYLHQDRLRAGHFHASQAGFVNARDVEREADLFAAALLMPKQEFTRRVRGKSQGVCDLRELIQFAGEVFRTSITSTAIRYAKLDIEPCSVVLSREGEVLYAVRSQEMAHRGLGFLRGGTRVPPTSETARLLSAPKPGIVGGAVDADVWFDRARPVRLWEEATFLGRTGLTLSYLVVEEQESDDIE